MKITINTYTDAAHLTIKSGFNTILEQIDEPAQRGHQIPADLIRNLISVANEMAKFNGVDRVRFVQDVAEYLLDDIELEQLIKALSL